MAAQNGSFVVAIDGAETVENPEGADVIITSAVLDRKTAAGGTLTFNVGVDGGPTTLHNGVDGNGTGPVASAAIQLWPADSDLLVAIASGSIGDFEGNLYVEYVRRV